MKLTTLALLATSALPTLADRWEVSWTVTNTIPGKKGIMVSTWYSSTNGARGEMLNYDNDKCLANPGPKGMLQFCIYKDWGKFLYVGQDWRCLKLTYAEYVDPKDQEKGGKEIYSEVAGPC